MNDQMRLALDKLQRVSLLDLPTPLEECPRLSEALGGPRIFIKRDDLTGLATGGNKSRRLEYVLGDAVAKGADTLLLAARVQSNHARQLSAAAAKLGLKVHLLLTVQDAIVPEIQSNFLLDDLLGADITLVRQEDIHRREEILQETAERLHREAHTPYVMNSHRAELLGGAAHVTGAIELCAQLDTVGIRADYVWMASAGQTLAGHMVAGKASGTGWKAVAQAYDPVPLGEQVEERRKSIAELAAQVSEFLNLDLSFSAQEVTFLNENVGETFAEATPWSVEAVRLVAQTEGILLDPLHTGRAMASLVDQIRQGNIGRAETVVFVHTGGTPNIFAFGDELASKRWALWTPGHA